MKINKNNELYVLRESVFQPVLSGCFQFICFVPNLGLHCYHVAFTSWFSLASHRKENPSQPQCINKSRVRAVVMLSDGSNKVNTARSFLYWDN